MTSSSDSLIKSLTRQRMASRSSAAGTSGASRRNIWYSEGCSSTLTAAPSQLEGIGSTSALPYPHNSGGMRSAFHWITRCRRRSSARGAAWPRRPGGQLELALHAQTLIRFAIRWPATAVTFICTARFISCRSTAIAGPAADNPRCSAPGSANDSRRSAPPHIDGVIANPAGRCAHADAWTSMMSAPSLSQLMTDLPIKIRSMRTRATRFVHVHPLRRPRLLKLRHARRAAVPPAPAVMPPRARDGACSRRTGRRRKPYDRKTGIRERLLIEPHP
ncbi:hypothetical protein SSTU70S_04913 [Stutzerimonas stutzeri]